MKELPLCKCGCGTPVEKATRKYYGDHFRNPPIMVTPDAVIKAFDLKDEPMELLDMRSPEIPISNSKEVCPLSKPDATIQYRDIKSKKLVKKPTTPIRPGKISKQNLMNTGSGIYIPC